MWRRWERWPILRIGMLRALNSQEKSRIALTNANSGYSVLAASSGVAAGLILDYQVFSLFCALCVIPVGLPLLLNAIHAWVAARVATLAASAVGISTVSLLFFGGLDSPVAYVMFPMLILPMLLFDPRQLGLMILGILLPLSAFIALAVLAAASVTLPLLPRFEPVTENVLELVVLIHSIIFLLAYAGTGYLGYYQARRTLAESHAEMANDLWQGAKLQSGLREVMTSPHFATDVFSQPYRGWSSGDGVSFLHGKDDVMWLRVSDGIGHGSSGGDAEIVDHLLFHDIVQDANGPLDAAIQLTTTLHRRFPSARLTYAYFMAMMYPDGRVNYLNLRQLAFHVRHEPIRLPEQGLSVGDPVHLERIRQHTVQLQPGERILVCTDGLYEGKFQKSEAKQPQVVGKARIEALASQSPRKIYQAIARLPEFTLRDDCLLVDVRYTPSQPQTDSSPHRS